MERKIFYILAFCSLSAMGQRVEVSPAPQSVEWGGKAFDVSAIAKGDVIFAEGVRGDSAVRHLDNLIPQHKEGYYLKVTPDSVILAGNDAAGLFYGRQTFGLLSGVKEVQEVEITDYPMTERRGVIEGFYGNPWSFDDRISQFEFYGKQKLNMYVYGPKDDPWHRDRWFEPYPEKEGEKLKELVEKARENNVEFIWAMHPSNSIVSETDRNSALQKFNQMYELGVRSFAVFFDDISSESVDDQIDYLNFLTEEFVRPKGDVSQLTVCPTQYNKRSAKGDYLKKMGEGLDKEIRIMWTGERVVDMIQGEDCDWFTAQTGRKPFIWLNYPVNDYGMHNLLMGPVAGNGEDVYSKVSAFCANPMQYAEASKVGLYSLADYLWNPGAYESTASWERSMKDLMPGREEAFRQFCLDNVDMGENSLGMRLYDESPEFKVILDSDSVLTKKNAHMYASYFRKMKEAGEALLSLRGNPIVDEIREFVDYYRLQGERGLLLCEMAGKPKKKRMKALRKEYEKLTKRGEELVSRVFEGSIQPVEVHTATLYVEPFLQREYKRRF